MKFSRISTNFLHSFEPFTGILRSVIRIPEILQNSKNKSVKHFQKLQNLPSSLKARKHLFFLNWHTSILCIRIVWTYCSQVSGRWSPESFDFAWILEEAKSRSRKITNGNKQLSTGIDAPKKVRTVESKLSSTRGKSQSNQQINGLVLKTKLNHLKMSDYYILISFIWLVWIWSIWKRVC